MHVDGPGPEVIATGEGHRSFSASSQQRPQNENRGPHLAHQVQRRLGQGNFRDINRQTGAIALTTGADVGEDLAKYNKAWNRVKAAK